MPILCASRAKRHDVPDDDDRRGGQSDGSRECGDLVEPADGGGLRIRRAPADDRDRGVRTPTALEQRGGNAPKTPDAHEDDEGISRSREP